MGRVLAIAELPVEKILPLIGSKKRKTIRLLDQEFLVHLGNASLRCFKRSLECVSCSIAGNIFVLKTYSNSARSNRRKSQRTTPNCFLDNCGWCGRKNERYQARHRALSVAFLNLYHRTSKGGLILMTQDHIIPQSRGGSSGLHNLQTMCTKCNSKKGNDLWYKN